MRYVLLLLLAASQLPAAEEWTRFSSPNFELFTSAAEKQGRELIQYFEQVRDLFMRIKASTVTTRLPVTIIAFKSMKQFQPWSPGPATAAYFTGDELRDYIVMSSVGSESYPSAVHEYMHLLVKHSGLKMPVWLNEGFAEVHSTVRPHGGQIMVGDVPKNYGIVLTQGSWLPLDVLTKVDQQSAHYNEGDKKGVLYAQSWLLTHMLMLSEGYRENFQRFVTAASTEGVSGAEAFQSIYGKSLADVEKDMRMYIRGNIKAVLFDTKLQKMAPPEKRAATPLEQGMNFARLSALLRHYDDAKQRFLDLAQRFPDQWEIAEAQAHLAWRQGDLDGARKHFARAVAAKSTSWKTYWDYARMLGGAGTSGEIISSLKKALELNPELAEGRLMLGFEAYRAGRYRETLLAFRDVKRIEPDRAHAFFMVLAHTNLQLKSKDNARNAAAAASKHARTPSERLEAERLLKYIDYEPPVRAEASSVNAAAPQLSAGVQERVPAAAVQSNRRATLKGSIQFVDCLGKEARLRLTAGGEAFALLVRDPGSVTIKHSGNTTVDFTCGPQKDAPVTVEYEPKVDNKYKTIGDVRTLDFRQ